MITSRKIDLNDRESIDEALARDAFHPTTKSEAFYEPNTFTNVYEDEGGPIMLVRASRSLRIDMMFFSNEDSERNRAAMLAGWDALIAGAKKSGFSEITTSSNSPALVAFGCRVLGFEKVQTEANGEVALLKAI